MEFKVALTYIFLLTTGSQAKKLPLEESRPYIVNLRLEFVEQKIPDFIVHSLFASQGWKESSYFCNIHLSDVLSIIPFKKVTAVDLNAATKQLDIQTDGDEITKFVQDLDYYELNQMGFNIASVYKNFVKTYLPMDPSKIIEVLNILGIDATDFLMAAYFGYEEEMFGALKEGNFSLETLAEIETLLNVKFNVKDLYKILGVKKLDPLYLNKFINEQFALYLRSKDIQENSISNFLKSFMLDIDDYKDMKAFKTCYKEVTQTTALGVATDKDIIITTGNIFSETTYEGFLKLVVTGAQSKTSYPVYSIEPLEKFDEILTISVLNYIEKATSYTDLDTKSCTYITNVGKKLIEEPTLAHMVGSELKISKTLDTTFKSGSPLICDNILYGLASSENMGSIIFDTFEEKVPVEEIVEDPTFLQSIGELFEKYGINPCEYFSCTPSDSEYDDFVVAPQLEGNNDLSQEISSETQESKEIEQEEALLENEIIVDGFENGDENVGLEQTIDETVQNEVVPEENLENQFSQNEEIPQEQENEGQINEENLIYEPVEEEIQKEGEIQEEIIEENGQIEEVNKEINIQDETPQEQNIEQGQVEEVIVEQEEGNVEQTNVQDNVEEIVNEEEIVPQGNEGQIDTEVVNQQDNLVEQSVDEQVDNNQQVDDIVDQQVGQEELQGVEEIEVQNLDEQAVEEINNQQVVEEVVGEQAVDEQINQQDVQPSIQEDIVQDVVDQQNGQEELQGVENVEVQNVEQAVEEINNQQVDVVEEIVEEQAVEEQVNQQDVQPSIQEDIVQDVQQDVQQQVVEEEAQDGQQDQFEPLEEQVVEVNQVENQEGGIENQNNEIQVDIIEEENVNQVNNEEEIIPNNEEEIISNNQEEIIPNNQEEIILNNQEEIIPNNEEIISNNEEEATNAKDLNVEETVISEANKLEIPSVPEEQVVEDPVGAEDVVKGDANVETIAAVPENLAEV